MYQFRTKKYEWQNSILKKFLIRRFNMIYLRNNNKKKIQKIKLYQIEKIEKEKKRGGRKEREWVYFFN